MNRIIRAFAAFIVSICLILAPTIQHANAASSWSVTSAVSAGARTVVTATKSGYKSAVNIMPTAGRLGLRLAKGANTAALAYAVYGLLGDGVDYVLDKDNNRIKYKIPSQKTWYINNANGYWHGDTAESVCTQYAGFLGLTFKNYVDYGKGTGGVCNTMEGRQFSATYGVSPIAPPEQYLSLDAVASQVVRNANSGHADSQAATRETAVEMVVGGQFDQDLLQGAVPIEDTKPLVPSVPISGNGNVTHGDSWDTGMSGATPGDQADAAKDAADAAKKAADAAADAAKDAQQAAADAAADAEDLVNSGADQDAIDAANDRAAAAEKAAKAAKDAANAAIDAANAKAAAAERAAQAAAQQAAADAAAAAKAAADAVAAAQAAAEADKAAAQAAADAAVAAAEKAKAEAEARAKAAEEAAKAAEKAKAEADKFELPAFCTWASVVCEYTKWVKDEYGNMSRWLKEEPASLAPEPITVIDDVDIGNWQEKANAGYVQFDGQCPTDVNIPINYMGASTNLSISYAPFCQFASMIKPAVILGAWISAMLIISGGRTRES